MPPTVAASAAAARALGYAGLADLILAEQLSPNHIATLFDMSASKYAAHDCAVIVLAGAVAHYRAEFQSWDGGVVERDLALNALAGEADPAAAAVGKLGNEAARLVSPSTSCSSPASRAGARNRLP
jgi:hypothetical protein